MMKLLKFALLWAVALCLQPAFAQGPWPSKPIRILVGVQPGLTMDAFARMYADALSKNLSVPVIVENKPGVGLTLANDAVAKAEPDGHTILWGASSSITMAPHLYSKLPYDTNRDLKPVTMTLGGAFMIVANNDFPARNLKELLSVVRSKPGLVSYASYGMGSAAHVGFELLSELAGLKMVHIPYRQGPVSDIMSGVVALGFEPAGSILPFIKSGKLKAIAYTGPQRFAQLPDVPTVAEEFPGYDISGWHGVFVPSKVPDTVVQRLYTEISKITDTPAIQVPLRDNGYEPRHTTAPEAARIIAKESAEMGAVIKRLNIRLD